MAPVDWAVVSVYMAGIVMIAVLLGRKQRNIRDYYLAGRKTPWWLSGFSTMATQLSAISFISAPAFVAIKQGGGMKWLCYEFGVPIGLLLVILFIMPALHRGGYISIYEYLERRFDRRTRVLVSVLFQLGRGLATAVSVLAGGLILSTALPLSTFQAILIIGAVTMIYDALGGIKAVIISDLIQMLIIIVGIGVCGIAALRLVGWGAAWDLLSPERSVILDFKHWGLSSGGEYGFWPMALGGVFLYASYYGCDQSQVQRELTVGDMGGVRKSLLFNVFGRFPVVLMYCVMGVLVGAVFASPDLLGRIATGMHTGPAAVTDMLRQDPDRMVPMFILNFLPPGVVGFVFIAIISALMSSLDSSINSLSAVTLQDFYRPYVRPNATQRHYLIVSKVFTLLWGVFCISAALAFTGVGEASRHTTIVLINAIGSLIYGPILAAFLLGLTMRRIGSVHVVTGVLAGIAANMAFWRLTDISWLWWNLTGFAVAAGTAVILSLLAPGVRGRGDAEFCGITVRWKLSYSVVIVYFFVIIAVSYVIQRMS